MNSLTMEDKDKIRELNSKNQYGLSQSMLRGLIKKHRTARNKDDLHTMESIEYRLTDINFHAECGLISKGKYKEALKLADEF